MLQMLARSEVCELFQASSTKQDGLEPESPIDLNKKNSALAEFINGAIDRARTDDNRYHKPGLYQLSYDRHQFTAVFLTII